MKVLFSLSRQHPWAVTGMVGCLLVAGLAEGIGLSAFLPLLTLAIGSDGADAASPSDLELKIRGLFEWAGIDLSIESILILVVAAFLLKGALVLVSRVQVGYLVARAVTELRLRLLRALMHSNWSYYVQQRVGTFSNAYSMEVVRSAKLFLEGTVLVTLAIETTVALTVAYMASSQATIGALAVSALLVLILSRVVRMGRKAGRKQTKLFSQMSERLTDVLQGVKPLKAMARESDVAPMLEKGTRRIEKARRLEIFSREALAAMQEPLMVPFLALGVYVGRVMFETPLQTILLLVALGVRVFRGLSKAQRRYQKILVDESAYESLMEKIEEAERSKEPETHGALPTLEREISLSGVQMRYEDRTLFDGLDLALPAGKIIALTGPSGSGKTTIVDLLVGLLTPESGEIRIDGRPLGEIDTRAWRRRIGYVPQEMFLLHDTVAMNVTLGDKSVPRQEIERALREAHAWSFVEAMPRGMDTLVGERGSALSGGQRQRIAIARALLHRPLLLVLDEATAALDPASEKVVWEAVESLRGRTTVIAVSHQPALLGVADLAFRVAEGAVTPVDLDRPPAGA
ncbi:MAG: ABC transporter ATP-binding protein [Myxococcota bacterium]